jgi:hypothetical protein
VEGVECSFLINGYKEAGIIRRLNTWRNDKNWLSLRPHKDRFTGYNGADFADFGEMNADNKFHGRGIVINSDGDIFIGYCKNGDWRAPGKFIWIFIGGEFEVGERYMKDGKLRDRVTLYKTDGTSKKYDR